MIEVGIFIAIIIAFAIYFHLKIDHIQYGATFLTTLGIFFTFLGISQGLYSLNANDIQGSLPTLLSGLKTAFWASCAGVFCALTIKIRILRIKHKNSNQNHISEEVSAKDLLIALTNITTSLVGKEETSLITQIKLLRQDTVDNLIALKKSQDKTLTQLSQASSQTLVQALQDVIKDFNNKITEQFGDNFKHLNQGVEKLVIWQQNYKNHIDEVGQNNKIIIENMHIATKDYQKVVENSTLFTNVASDLNTILQSLYQQKSTLQSMLHNLANLINKASDGLPTIEDKIMHITNQLSNAVSDNQNTINKTLSENSLLIRNSIQKVGHDFDEVNKKFNENMTKQFAVLDAALSEELNKSLNSLGKQLSSLSEKFVSDYLPLTEKLRHIVSIAKDI